MIKVIPLTEFQDILPLKDDWNRLLKKSDTNTVFLTFEWITTWWKHFGKDRSLLVLLIKFGGRLIGIAPLMISEYKKLGMQIRKVEFIGTPLSDYLDFIVSEKKKRLYRKYTLIYPCYPGGIQ